MTVSTATRSEERCCRVVQWIAVLCAVGVFTSCKPAPIPTPTATPTATPTPALASLHLDVGPTGATVYVNGEEKGHTPLTLRLPEGSYKVHVQREGYDPWQRDVELRPGDQVLVAEALRDAAPPVVTLSELPTGGVHVGQPIQIGALATDNETVAFMRLRIDGEWVSKVKDSVLAYTWDTHSAEAGTHMIVVAASDHAGNVSEASRTVDIMARATPQPSPTPEPTVTARPDMSAHVTAVTLLTYPYEPYLRERVDPRYNFRVVWLDRAAYEASNPQPQLRTFKAIVLENRYLSLTFLPELGGRLYGCALKSSGQNIFYHNAVLKPSYWGPLRRDENWWLAAGGIEWALPVHEHGYEWGLFWTYDVEEQADGVSIVLRDKTADERYRNDCLWTEIRVTLPEDRAYFVVEPRLVNPTSQAVAFQFWLNAALTLGSASTSGNTEFVYPTERMIVHSTGDPALPGERQTMTWPVYNGRDLSHYRNWRNWLGVFVPDAQQNYVGAYNHDTGLGIVRVFAPEVVPGLKLFSFGADFPARAEYSDDGSDYFEMWAGPCRTFWPEDDVILGPGQSLHWSEIWLPFRRIGGLDRANAEVVVKADVRDSQVHLGITVSQTRRVHFELEWDGQSFYQQVADLSPDTPLLAQVPLPSRAALAGELTVRVNDHNGVALLAYTKDIAP